MEKWVDIIGFETEYKISNTGRVVSKDRLVKSAIKNVRQILKKSKEITNKKTPTGYCFVILYKQGKANMNLVHRLVASHFLENKCKCPQVNHIDGDKANNHVSNLEWCTALENKKHASDNGLVSRGVNRWSAKIDDGTVRKIREYKGLKTAKFVSETYGVSRTNIYDIWNGKIWKHVL